MENAYRLNSIDRRSDVSVSVVPEHSPREGETDGDGLIGYCCCWRTRGGYIRLKRMAHGSTIDGCVHWSPFFSRFFLH